MDEKILSDWGWRRNDKLDETAREIYESVIHVNIVNFYYTDNICRRKKTAVQPNVSFYEEIISIKTFIPGKK